MNKTASHARCMMAMAGAVLLLAALACGGGNATPAPPTVDINATAAALQATANALAAQQTQAAQVPPTPIQLPTAEPQQPTPGGSTSISGTYYDDFSSDVGNWEIFSTDIGSAQISQGVLLLGPFSECADIGAGSKPFGCFTQCLACGTLAEYDMQVDAAYISGRTDQTFGMMLRFIDENDNGYVDPEDYFLDFELSIFDKRFLVFEHRPNAGYETLDERFEDNIAGGTSINTLRAVAYNGGTEFDLYINGVNVEHITIDPAFSAGTVGLVVGFRNMQAGFDNFTITIP